MVRRILFLVISIVWGSFTFAQQPQSLTKLSLDAGKNPEGIAVNPVTHKAYVVAEDDATDQKVVVVFDSAALNGKSAPKKLTLAPIVPGQTTHPPTLVPIANESEYITVDATRNRVYLSTRFGLKEDSEGGGNDETGGEDAGDAPLPAQGETLILGTLTVIDGNTDTVIATYGFPEGQEPEGVAVDTYRNIVYVGIKAPEPEPANGACPAGTFFIDRDGDEECWTAGSILAFNAADITTGPINTIPAGDDPESIVFVKGLVPDNDMVYAANEDDGTVTIAHFVNPDGSGGGLVTDTPAYVPAIPPYSLGVFFSFGPNVLACPDKQFEADKMAVGWDGSAYSVYITDDKSRVAKILGANVVGETGMPIDPNLGQCDLAKGNDENGLNTANNIAFMQTSSRSAIYVVSEQNTVAILDPLTLALRTTITVPGAVHLDAIGVDGAANRIWITDEGLQALFVLQGACANGTGTCAKQ